MHASSLCAFVSAHAYLEQNSISQSGPPIPVNYILGRGKNKTKRDRIISKFDPQEFLNESRKRKGNEKKEENGIEKERVRERKAVECRLIDTWRGEKFFKEDDLRVVQAKQIFTSIRSMDFPPSSSLGNFEWMANERKKKKKKKKEKKEKGGGCTMAQSQRQKSYRGCRRGN